LREKLSQLQQTDSLKPSSKPKKTQSSKQQPQQYNINDNKENIDLEELEAETARIHKEFMEAGDLKKRTASDNTRPLTD
jgi:hypothetical protein